jgi:hypothetical protein
VDCGVSMDGLSLREVGFEGWGSRGREREWLRGLTRRTQTNGTWSSWLEKNGVRAERYGDPIARY